MLTIFICPKCFNYRIVSRKPDASCFHCGAALHKSDIKFVDYVNMSVEERITYKENFIKRLKHYKECTDNILTEQELK
mgnify:CR=1 FL=1